MVFIYGLSGGSGRWGRSDYVNANIPRYEQTQQTHQRSETFLSPSMDVGPRIKARRLRFQKVGSGRCCFVRPPVACR